MGGATQIAAPLLGGESEQLIDRALDSVGKHVQVVNHLAVGAEAEKHARWRGFSTSMTLQV